MLNNQVILVGRIEEIEQDNFKISVSEKYSNYGEEYFSIYANDIIIRSLKILYGKGYMVEIKGHLEEYQGIIKIVAERVKVTTK